MTSCPQKLGERGGIDSLAEHLTSRSVRNKLLLSCAAPFVAFVVTAPGIRDMLPLTRPLSSPPWNTAFPPKDFSAPVCCWGLALLLSYRREKPEKPGAY